MIDLHIHSTASDGSLSPTEIIDLASDLELGAIAITDHDTIEGAKEALRIGIPPSLGFLTGVEISASTPPPFSFSGSFHILGYSIRLDDSGLNHALGVLQQARKDRNPQIIERLNRLGIAISLEEILAEVGECQLGRPHIAQLMVKKGYVKSIDEAFDIYIGKGQPAYVDKYQIECLRAIEMIRGAGGIPVLAHPFLLDAKSDEHLEELIRALKEMGLQGIEVFYPGHTPQHVALYAGLAQRYGLLMTGGTDFHGSINPEIRMGSGKGDFCVPYQVYETLINRP